MRKPNLFIVGAPKCGTTSLYDYLQGHPNIYMSPIKEPRYFSDDIPWSRSVRDWNDYCRLFQDAGPEHLYVGEASPSYLRSQAALPKIQAINPQAVILVMLRHPVEMAQAYHAEMLYHYNETVADLEEAWFLQESRGQGRDFPERCRNPQGLQYRSIIRPAEQVERLFQLFPRQQIKVMLLEDMRADARSFYLDLLGFLHLDDDGRNDFSAANENRVWVSDRVGRLIMDPPPWMRSGARMYKKVFGLKDIAWKEKLRTGSSQIVSKPDISPGFRMHLLDEYRTEVDRLEELLQRDLSMWRQ